MAGKFVVELITGFDVTGAEKGICAGPLHHVDHDHMFARDRVDALYETVRNSRVAEIGTVEVTESYTIERYSHVMHIVSNVQGQIKSALNALQALVAGFPAGTVSGAPKIRAMEIIDELESERRSFYAGTVGYFGANGDMDTCITLRTALVRDGTMYVQAGGGVVADSDPEAEYQESKNKAKALLRAAAEAQRYANISG